MVDIIPKQNDTQLSSIALTAALVLLVVAVGSFVLFTFLKARTQGRLTQATEQLLAGKSVEEAALESRILSTKTKIEDFAAIVGMRSNPSPFFTFIEANTHSEVSFSQLALNPQGGKAVVNGETRTFRNLEEQVAQLRAHEDAKEVELTAITLGEAGQVRFTLTLVFETSFFTTP